MPRLIYIGNKTNIINHFTSLFNGELKVAATYFEAAKMLSKNEKTPTVILFEKNSLKKIWQIFRIYTISFITPI